jgi:hypothetical protein
MEKSEEPKAHPCSASDVKRTFKDFTRKLYLIVNCDISMNSDIKNLLNYRKNFIDVQKRHYQKERKQICYELVYTFLIKSTISAH